MKKTAIALVLLVGLASSLADNGWTKKAGGEEKLAKVVFADQNLEAAVRKAIRKPQGDLLTSDLKKLEDLGTIAKGIENLSGIEQCTNLVSLFFTNESDFRCHTSGRTKETHQALS